MHQNTKYKSINVKLVFPTTGNVLQMPSSLSSTSLTPVNNPVPMLLFHHHPDVCVSSPQAPHSCLYTHVEYHMCAYSKFFWFVSAVYLHENEKQSSSMSRNFAWKIQGLKQKQCVFFQQTCYRTFLLLLPPRFTTSLFASFKSLWNVYVNVKMR